jgi:flagellar motor switch protein FliG
MLDKNTALLLHRDVDSICHQILSSYQDLVGFIRTLTNFDPYLADLIEQKVSLSDPELGELLIRNKYSFEMVLLLEDTAITEVLKRVDKQVLTLSLKGCDEAVQGQFFRNMSSKAVELMKEDLEFLGPVRAREVRKCQREIVDMIKQLRDQGIISIGGAPGEPDYIS